MAHDIKLTYKEQSALIGHPRLVELYIIMNYDMFTEYLGEEATLKFFRLLCENHTIDFDRVRLLLSRYSRVKEMLRKNKDRYYKEITLLAAVHGKTRYWVADKWLRQARSTVYAKTGGVKKEELMSEDFLKAMDDEPVLGASKDIYRELFRFQDALRALEGVYL